MSAARIYESDLDYRDDPVVILENDHLLVAFDVIRGGRCITFLDKRTAIDFVGMNRWNEPGTGLLDDFNGNGLYPAPFRPTLVQHECRSDGRGVELVMKTVERRFKTVPMDVQLTKRVRLPHDSAKLEVTYDLANLSRQTLTLDLNLCNFIQPWGEEMQIVVPKAGGLRVEKAKGGWQLFREEDLADGWCATFGPRTGRGLRICADFRLTKAWSAYARGKGFSMDVDTFLFCLLPGKSQKFSLTVEPLIDCFEARAAVPIAAPRRRRRLGDPPATQIAAGLPVASRYLKDMQRKAPPPHPRLYFSEKDLPALRKAPEHPMNQALREHVLAVADRLWSCCARESSPSGNQQLYLAYAWLLIGEPRYFQAARNSLLEEAGQKKGDPITRAILYDWLYQELSPAERRRVREVDLPKLRHDYAHYVSAAGHHPRGLMGTGMKRHCPNPLAWAEVVPFGLAGLAYWGEIPDAPAWVEYARRTTIGFLEYFNVVAIQTWKTVGHSHGTQGHFVVLAGPEFLISDPGYILASPYHTARWHNLLVVDGQEQFDWDAEHFQGSPAGCLRLAASTREYDHFVADLTMSYRGLLSLYQRHLIYLRPRTVVVIDDAQAVSEHYFDFYLQCAARPKRRGGGFFFEHRGQPVHLSFFTAEPFRWSVVSRKPDGHRLHHALAISLKKPEARFLSAMVIQAPKGVESAEVNGRATLTNLAIEIRQWSRSARLDFWPAGKERGIAARSKEGLRLSLGG